jgi:hypothetical protein
MNETAARSLEAVEADLHLTTDLRLRVLDEPATNDPREDSFWLVSSHGMRTGVLVARGQSDPERLVSVADQIQEFVHEELSMLGRPAAWPACPEHPRTHPLAPALVAGQPSWQCPASGTVVGRIGSLTKTTAGGRTTTGDQLEVGGGGGVGWR